MNKDQHNFNVKYVHITQKILSDLKEEKVLDVTNVDQILGYQKKYVENILNIYLIMILIDAVQIGW